MYKFFEKYILTGAKWIQEELCSKILAESNDYVSLIRKYRQNYLFKAFNKEYSQLYQSSFIMDMVLPHLVSSNEDCHTLVLWDEFKAYDVEKDWTPKIENIPADVFVAVEPLSWPKFDEKRETTDSNCMIKFLPTKHRTCKQIDQFVSATIREKGDLQAESDNKQPVKLDYHLEDRHLTLPPGQKPIWIFSYDLSFEELEPKLQELTQDCGEILAISKFQHENFIRFCSMMNWKFANADDIIGSETNCLIAFGVPINQNLEELISRARNKLIIITSNDTRY